MDYTEQKIAEQMCQEILLFYSLTLSLWPSIIDNPLNGYLFKTQAQKTRNQGVEKLRSMLKIIRVFMIKHLLFEMP
jgi:hypothetical protein